MFRKIVLFISSYIPLYILMIIKNILERVTDKGRFIGLIGRKIKLFDEVNDYALVLLIFLCLSSFMYLQRKIKSTEGKKYYKIVSVEDQTSNYYFNYISIYLLSCLGLTLNNIVDVFVLSFLMLIVGYIYISNRMTYMNPTLNLIGYKVYNAELLRKSSNNDKTFKSIIIAPKRIIIKENSEIIATGKQDFIFVKDNLSSKVV